MPICAKCQAKFPNHLRIDGVRRTLCKRKFCLGCSPYKMHNTRDITKLRKTARQSATCPICSKPVKAYRQKFCSYACFQTFRHSKWIADWLSGKQDGVHDGGRSTSKHIKRYMIQKYGAKCQQCGWAEKNPFTGLVPITLDHIDGNSHNNREENLRLLCPNCHSLTPTYGNLNKGKSKRNRRKYYQKTGA